jgi:hypothetical protein
MQCNVTSYKHTLEFGRQWADTYLRGSLETVYAATTGCCILSRRSAFDSYCMFKERHQLTLQRAGPLDQARNIATCAPINSCLINLIALQLGKMILRGTSKWERVALSLQNQSSSPSLKRS